MIYTVGPGENYLRAQRESNGRVYRVGRLSRRDYAIEIDVGGSPAPRNQRND
jgi:hypothetical protein